MLYRLPIKHNLRVLTVLIATACMSACSSTVTQTSSLPISNTSYPISKDYYQRLENACEQQAMDMDSFAQKSGQTAQYLASANAILRCVNGIPFPKGHPDSDKALRLMAVAVMNYVKGGDIDGAKVALRKTRSKFPDQDLYFADYSSFIDTATALLEQQTLSGHQLAALNISSELRAEIKRHQYWLSH